MGETKPRKVVARNVAIALGTACIILVAFLVLTTIYLVSTINDRNSTINQRDNAIADLNDTVNLRKYTIWVNNETVTQAAGNYTSWTFSASVAGYIQATTTSITNNTYLEVKYNATIHVGFEYDHSYSYMGFVYQNYHYDNQITFRSGTAQNIFPILPWSVDDPSGTSIVEIRVGNTNTVENATETVLVTYYY